MTKKPILNALAALAYISVVATFMYYGPEKSGPIHSPIIPIGILSLFTLSAGVMAYIFFWQPFQLYFNNKKKEAVELAFKSLVSFAVITVLILALIFLRLIPFA